MTVKQLNQQHPEKFVMVTYEFGKPVFIGPCVAGENQMAETIEEAEKWSYADSLSMMKLNYQRAATGYKGLKWETVQA